MRVHRTGTGGLVALQNHSSVHSMQERENTKTMYNHEEISARLRDRWEIRGKFLEKKLCFQESMAKSMVPTTWIPSVSETIQAKTEERTLYKNSAFQNLTAD